MSLQSVNETEHERFLSLTKEAQAGMNECADNMRAIYEDNTLTDKEKHQRVQAIMPDVDKYAALFKEAGKIGAL